jgi:predicted RND superfamily exporter protein
VDRRADVYLDTRWVDENVSGLVSFSLWLKTAPGGVLDPAFLARVDAFAAALERDPRVGSVTGITSVLRLRRYASGQGDTVGDDPREWFRLAADLETLLLREAGLRTYVDVGSLADTRLDVLTRAGVPVQIEELAPDIRGLWERTGDPARLEVVGHGVLSEKIGLHLVPTLVESFVLTAVLIFVTFFVVFRNPAARLMAMIPSLFAILVMFLLMRLAGVPLNVATILIATTVLGATENDQIHFFFHFQEKRREASTEEALKHAIRVAGSAIFFATLVNAGGFLALALSDLPPMRQFGLLSASAFALSMLADFTALPAALWIVFRERPDGGGRST